ncbi:MAG: FecR domain-containing protein [Dechloromonas sp.]|nr:FecR domain-containing protein [Dechloromonas sp.]
MLMYMNAMLSEFRLAFGALLLMPAVVWANAATVDFVVGSAFAVTPAGVERKLAKGSDVQTGDVVKTGADGRVQLRFSDGAMLSLQPQSDFRLDNYQFSGKADGRERGFFSLLKGGFRTITGLIGRSNRDNYQTRTAVATIGIRGTEYSATYLDRERVAISTGEGAIEVCTAVGVCQILSGGESAEVDKQKGILRVSSKPRLEPAQPRGSMLAQFSTSESKNPDGSVPLNSKQLVSGPGYTLVWYADSPGHGDDHESGDNRGSLGGVEPDVTAQFDKNSRLLSAQSSPPWRFQGNQPAESGVADGVIGWGRWATATNPPNGALNDYHYVIGRPTPVGDLVALSGRTVTYSMVGYTIPTGSPSGTGGVPSGTLTASFYPATMKVEMNLQVPFNASTYSVNASTGLSAIPIASSWTWDSGRGASGGGVFSGVNASHAGATYNANLGDANVSGAVAFKR